MVGLRRGVRFCCGWGWEGGWTGRLLAFAVWRAVVLGVRAHVLCCRSEGTLATCRAAAIGSGTAMLSVLGAEEIRCCSSDG